MTALYSSEQINELMAFFLTRDAWQSWTPTVTQSVAVAVSIAHARYVVLGDTVIFSARLNVTGAGTAGSVISIGGMPGAVLPANAPVEIGVIEVNNSGTAFYVGVLSEFGAGDWRGRAHLETSTIGITPNFGLASGDFIGIRGAYER